MKLISVLLSCALCVQSVAVMAQTDRVLRDKEINESALIEALNPEPVMGQTRSIRVMPAGEAAPAPKRPQASMLITFETNSAELTPKAKDMLDVLGRALQSDKLAQFKFAIEGHADPRSGADFNLQLSQTRATTVVRYLAEHQHISKSRLTAIGKGQSELLNTHDPVAPENRRVTVKTLME